MRRKVLPVMVGEYYDEKKKKKKKVTEVLKIKFCD